MARKVIENQYRYVINLDERELFHATLYTIQPDKSETENYSIKTLEYAVEMMEDGFIDDIRDGDQVAKYARYIQGKDEESVLVLGENDEVQMSECEHVPDMSTLTITHEEDGTALIDVECKDCSESGCFAKPLTASDEINWD